MTFHAKIPIGKGMELMKRGFIVWFIFVLTRDIRSCSHFFAEDV